MKEKYHFGGAMLKDIVYREFLTIYNCYRPFFIKGKGNRYVFMADGTRPHGGMFDRLKGLISIYAIAKAQEKQFKISFTHPFYLEHFLVPNKCNWFIQKEDLHYSFPASRPIYAYGETSHPFRLMKNRKGEVHFYYGFDSLQDINRKFGTNYEWGVLYRELFRPSELLQHTIAHYKEKVGQDYIACHCRIMNLLGEKVEAFGNQLVLSKEKQEVLKEKLLNGILAIAKNHPGKRILLATDNNIFAEYAQKHSKQVYIVPGDIKHIDTTGQTAEDTYLKLFLDYYMIAEAQYVYSIIGGRLYPSAFPQYAAKIGGKPFERVELDLPI